MIALGVCKSVVRGLGPPPLPLVLLKPAARLLLL
jgi:hypothetical protein